MKIQVVPKELSKAIAIAQKASAGKTTQPILECIFFEAKNQELILRSTDLECFIETRMPCDIQEEGCSVIPASLVGNIIRKLPDAPAVLTQHGDELLIDCQEAHFRLQTRSPQEYPSFPELRAQAMLRISNEKLNLAFKQTEFATALDRSRIELTGIYLDPQETSIRAISMDGYRVAIKTMEDVQEMELHALPYHLSSEIEKEGDAVRHQTNEGEISRFGGLKPMIIPRRAVSEWMKIMDTEKETYFISMDHYVVFADEQTVFYARLIDHDYMDYNRVLDALGHQHVRVNRLYLLQALERVSLLNQYDQTNQVKVIFSPSTLRLESANEIGRVNEEVPIENDGEELFIGFNARFLLEGLRVLSSDYVEMILQGAIGPMLMKSEGDDSYLYITMPIRLAQMN